MLKATIRWDVEFPRVGSLRKLQSAPLLQAACVSPRCRGSREQCHSLGGVPYFFSPFRTRCSVSHPSETFENKNPRATRPTSLCAIKGRSYRATYNFSSNFPTFVFAQFFLFSIFSIFCFSNIGMRSLSKWFALCYISKLSKQILLFLLFLFLLEENSGTFGKSC